MDDPAADAIAPAPATKAKPTHYSVTCISLYTEDEDRLEAMVESLRARGMTKASKSWLIRQALNRVSPAILDELVQAHEASKYTR